MKTLLPGVSIPRDVSSATHEESIHDPLHLHEHKASKAEGRNVHNPT